MVADDTARTWGDGAPPIPPPPGAPVALDAGVVRRSGGRGRLALGALLAVAVVGGGLVVLTSAGDDGDPVAALQAAQAVVESSDSYRFEVLTVSRQVLGDPDGAGSDTTTRSLLAGTVASPERWHVTVDVGDSFGVDIPPMESLRVDDTMYSTDPFMEGTDSTGPRWLASPYEAMDLSPDDLAQIYEDMDAGISEDDGYAEFGDSMLLGFVMNAYLSEMETDPTSLTRVVTESTDPEIEEHLQDGGVRLRTRLAPIPEFAKVADDPIPVVDVVLDLDAGDRPVRATFTAEAGSASARVEVTFTDWGTALTVEAPDDAEIDHDPWLAAEALAAVDAALLMAPTDLPAGLELVSADVYSDSLMGGDSDCESVELSYSREADFSYDPELDPGADMTDEEMEAFFDEMDFLTLSISTIECWKDLGFGSVDDELDDELGGQPAMGGDGYWEVQVGDAVVTVSSTLEDEVVATMVASIGPVTVGELDAAIPAWARVADRYGDGFVGAWAAGGF